ncbi:hypothetical protein BD769DRAFT_1385709 [Suillus cothurnatus]|nr:hypothetical protein BD769DRAFT_1385709 [Suillus cothurnatus]
MLREAGLVLQTAVKLESEHGLMDEDKQTAVKYFTFAEVWYKFRLNQCTGFRFTIERMTSVMVDGDGDRIAAESWEKNRMKNYIAKFAYRTLQAIVEVIPYDEARLMLPEMCLKYWCCTAAVTTNRNYNF